MRDTGRPVAPVIDYAMSRARQIRQTGINLRRLERYMMKTGASGL